MSGIVNRLTRRDYRDFYRKHVSGVEVPPYDTILGYAGYQAQTTSRKSPTIGVGLGRSSEGVRMVGSRNDSIYKIVELPNPSPDQIKIREAWLKTGK
jgi:hypothetical protein